MKTVEEIKRPLIKGETLLVPCLVRSELIDMDEEDLWMDLSNITKKEIIYILPVINTPHSDKENGQNEIHYHADNRFIDRAKIAPKRNKKVEKVFSTNQRPIKTKEEIKYIPLKVITELHYGNTPVELISKSKLKHKCIHKGKCPHRGADLSQVKPIDGILTCPLHGLKFNERTKKIVNL